MFAQSADYQPPSLNRGANMSVQATTPATPAGVPNSVSVAMAFIQQSCVAKGPRGFTKFAGCDMYDEVIEVELLAKHEAAFNQACNLMGTYFDNESARVRRQGALEEALFIKQHGVLLESMLGDELGPENTDTLSENEPGDDESTEGQDVHGYE